MKNDKHPSGKFISTKFGKNRMKITTLKFFEIFKESISTISTISSVPNTYREYLSSGEKRKYDSQISGTFHLEVAVKS